MMTNPRAGIAALLGTIGIAIAAQTGTLEAQHGKIAGSASTAAEKASDMTNQSFVGMWVTSDGHIRLELLPNGRYDEARGTRKSAYTGSYTVEENQIYFVDDSGFTATGSVVDGVLTAGPDKFRRER